MSILEKIIASYTLPSCLVCGQITSDICAGCAESVFSKTLPVCFSCNTYTNTYKTCSTCRQASAPKHVWTTFEYKDEVKELIKKYKYQKTRSVVESMVPHMVSVLPYGSQFDFVTYVPTATKRVRLRGFDHAQLLASHVAKRIRVPNVGLLVKTNQHRQVGSSRAERQRNMDNSFRPVHKPLIKDSKLLIVDDVVSTGSTLKACAKVLKQNGAKSVDALVFAKNA